MPMPNEAYLGTAGELVALMHKEGKTEANKDAVLIQLLAFVGNYVGNDKYVMIGNDKHQPIIWPVIVGETAAGKGTSLGAVRRVFSALDRTYMSTNLVAGVGSGEGIIEKLSPKPDDDGVEVYPDPRLLVIEEEFTSVLRRSKRDGSTLSQTLMLAWDGKPLGSLTRKDDTSVIDHNTTVIGHVTPRGLEGELSAADFSNGMVNRLTFLRVGVKAAIARPAGMTEEEVAEAVSILRRVFTARSGEYALTSSAWEAWELNHAKFRQTGDTKADEALGRTRPQVFRLALIYALLDESNVIDHRHMRAAAAVVIESIGVVRGLFGDDDAIRFEKVLKRFEKGSGPMPPREIRRIAFGGARQAQTDARDWLQSLVDDGRLVRFENTQRFTLPELLGH